MLVLVNVESSLRKLVSLVSLKSLEGVKCEKEVMQFVLRLSMLVEEDRETSVAGVMVVPLRPF